MARGKIRIVRIQNFTNRQIVCSRMWSVLFKKAHELTVLCDARIFMIVVTDKGKCFEYISPSMRAKDMIDRYQRTLGIDLWSEHYERMEEDLKRLKDTNVGLRRQIGQMTRGEHLNGLSFEELIALEREIEGSLEALREHKYHKIRSYIDVRRKKLKSLEYLLTDPDYGVVDNEGVYDYRVHHIVAPNQPIRDGQTESCLTTNSSVSRQDESVCIPCPSLNLPDATSEDIQI